jgi:valyl-tRNA synthetase
MIMMTKKFTGKIPFKEIYITGLVRDENGDKMSKSKGNVLDPIDVIDGIGLDALIEKRTTGMMQPKLAAKVTKQTKQQFPNGIDAYGTDALRFNFAAMASTSRDINFDMSRVEGYRNFCNKIWNATRFVLMNTEDFDTGNKGGELTFSPFDRWIWSRFERTVAQFEAHVADYRFDLAANTLYEFTWNQFCDWYLELSKPVVNSDATSEAQKRGTRYTLINVLEQLMRVMHPFMPFITDEIWKKIKPLSANTTQVPSIMLDRFVSFEASMLDESAEQEIEWVKSFVVGIRNIRGEMDIAPSKRLPVLLNNLNDVDHQRLENTQQYLTMLAKLESIEILEKADEAPACATALVGEMEIMIPMAGLIDKEAELARLKKAADKLVAEVQRTEGKLNNQNFVGKAPAQVIDKEKAKLADAQMQLSKIQEQQAAIAKL